MNRWNIAVCDDERAALGILSGAIESAFRAHDIEAAIEMFSRPKELLERMAHCSFDLIFLDIEMPGMDGLTLAKRLRGEGNNVDIIYISNREDLVFDALRLNPKGFIRKSRFIQDITGVIDAYFAARGEDRSDTLLVETGGETMYLPIKQLMYIEGAGKAQQLYVSGRKTPVELHKNLQGLEEQLAPYGFLRVHKGFLVNYRFIQRIGDSEIHLINGQTIPLSRRKQQDIRDQYLVLMQGEGNVIL